MLLTFINIFTKYRKWLFIIFSIKLVLFIYFAIQHYQLYPKNLIVGKIFLKTHGDHEGYFMPAEDFANGLGYTYYCRMPGLVPIYSPLYFFFGDTVSKVLFIVLQFINTCFSVLLLGIIARKIFNSENAFKLTILLYSISTFVSIFDHQGLTESFSTSFFILSVYLFLRYKESGTISFLIWCGVFVTWGLFLRQIFGLIIPLINLFILFKPDFSFSGWRKKIIHCGLFSTPFIIAILHWNIYNYIKYKEIVILNGSMKECFSDVARIAGISRLVIGWGGDYEEWSVGTEMQWFAVPPAYKDKPAPFTERHYCGYYNYDSLVVLRTIAQNAWRTEMLKPDSTEYYRKQMEEMSLRFLNAYKNEKPIAYYITNPLRLMGGLLFSKNLENMPFHKGKNMRMDELVIKAFYLVLFNFINFIGLAGIILLLLHRNKTAILVSLFPITIYFFIGYVFGYDEQRYMVPVYPFMVIFGSYFLLFITSNFRRFSKSPS